MWRRLSSQLRTLTQQRSGSMLNRLATSNVFSSPSPHRPITALFSFHFASDSDNVVLKKRVEDVMPIATGHEREELEAELQGRKVLNIDNPEGPFGTKEAPSVIKSYYDKRIVGCPGGEGEDEHDVVWFWLEKGKPHECPVCTQYFVLEVVGPGGPPDGHGDDEHH
ncbi:Cytochrome c oxidase subunit 5b-1 like [Actinidia chinensis var. chinensis]|uniref:Cytochrome c oxidase subunit 5b-1 like n=1 Tax=Actinidia chinensis var. chinensis TaxID=1590841 RepID=A0A2R6PSR1_ACTCC|nr:Cytochrome c oxidase subunit 5b-1 like [Actinidia chinensis var. chinensis]